MLHENLPIAQDPQDIAPDQQATQAGIQHMTEQKMLTMLSVSANKMKEK